MRTKLGSVAHRVRVGATRLPRNRGSVLASAVLAFALAATFGRSARAGDTPLMTRLCRAAETDNLSAVTAMVTNERPDGGECSLALACAAEQGHLAIVQYVFEHCHKIGDADHACENAFKHRHLEVLHYLADHVSEPCPSNGLKVAAREGDLALVQILTASEPSANELECTFALEEAAENGHLAIVQHLLSHCRKIHEIGTALENATEGKYLEEVRCLIDHQPSESELRNAVMIAINQGWDEGLALLLQPQLGLDNLNEGLRHAAKEGRLSTVKLLVEHGANDLKGAIWDSTCSLDVVSYLVEKGARDLADGLHMCATKGDLAVVRYLVEHGARVDETTLAASLGNEDEAQRRLIASFLLEKGARAQSLEFESLARVVGSGDLALLKKLMVRGASLRVRNEHGEGLLGLAADPAMRAFLHSHGVRTSWGEHWFHTKKNVGQWSSKHYPVFFALAGLAYLGSSIYLREVTYRGHPLDNGFGTANAMLSMGVAGALSLGIAGGLIASIGQTHHSDSYGGAMGEAMQSLLGVFVGGMVGLAGGMVAGYYCRDFFKRNAVAYYALPTTAFVVPLLWAVF